MIQHQNFMALACNKILPPQSSNSSGCHLHDASANPRQSALAFNLFLLLTSSNDAWPQVDDKAVQTPFEGGARVHMSFPEVLKSWTQLRTTHVSLPPLSVLQG